MEETKKIPPENRPKSRARALIIVLIVGVILAIGGIWFWNYSQTYESTDDAQVECHLDGVSARIQGTITAVHADQNQFVKSGQVLVEIDPRDYQVSLEEARAQVGQAQAEIQAQNPNVPLTQATSRTNITGTEADVANARAAIASAESDQAAAQAQVRQAEANNTKAQADVARYRSLAEKDEISKQQYDQAVATASAQAATVEAARAQAVAAEKIVDQRRAQMAQAESRLSQVSSTAPQQLAISRANVQAREAQERTARVQVDRALLNLSYTKVPSPVDGIVTRRSAELGSTVQPGQQLFLIAETGDLWVTANFKETQLKRIRAGLHATLSVDALDRDFSGYVESLPASTGAVTSLLPPENATGNYVKVVQRMPVRLRFDKNQEGLDKLRPGMSVEPKVWLK